MPRQLLDIDETKVLKMARHGMTNVEIADIFDCDPSTISKRFSRTLTKGRAQRKNALRRCQYKAAIQGSVPMLIWLGKQDLGQADKIETKTETHAIVSAEKQRRMLRSERAFDLASDLEEEIIRSAPSAYDAARHDDPGGIRPSGQ